MRQNFTRFFALMMLCFSINTMNAQTVVWPVSTDTNTVKASQFADSSLVFQKTATKSPAADYKGWVSVGISSDDPAKKDSAQWVWSRTGRSRGNFVGAARQVASPTAANGTVIFDSDFLDTRGLANNFGGGSAPSPHKGELISPTMNATGFTDLIVEFNQLYRAFDSDCSIQYSNDDGATWSKQYFVNGEVAANASTPNPLITTNTDSTKKTVILFGSTGSNKFKIKFVFEGDYYFWILDDVKLINNKYYDMQMSTNFYAIPPTAYTPVNQLDTIRFLADVSNAGTNSMNNVKLQVKVWRDADKALIYNSTTSQYPASFKPDTAYENRILPDVLPPSALSQVGKYFGSYRVLGDSSKVDINPANDTIRFEFWVSDTTAANSVTVTGVGRSNYSKENANTTTTRLGNGYWTGTEPRSVRYGNYYRINKAPATITTLTTRLNAKAAAGRRIQGSLYEWKDANNDGGIQAAERTLVAASDTLIPTNTANANAWYVFRMTDINTNGFFYPKANTDYIAVVEYDAASIAAPVDSNYIQMVFNDGTFNYGAMRYVTDSTGSPRYSIILGKTADSDWSTGGFTNQFLVPVARLNVLPFRLTSTPTVLAGNNKIELSPNPVGKGSMVNINVDLEKSSDVLFRVMSVEGKLMAEQVLDKFKTQNIQLDVNDYPNGTYMVQILTQEGIMTKRFVKAD
jgi:Secretion system C-terminal sorting domain